MDKNHETPGRIAVVGAGIAGLYATALLLEKGYEVELFEASAQIGGRIKAGTIGGDYHFDLGGQWLHHIDHAPNSLTNILEQAKADYHEDSLGRYIYAADAVEEEAALKAAFRKQVSSKMSDPDRTVKECIEHFSEKHRELTYLIDAELVDMAATSEEFSAVEFIELAKQVHPTDYLLERGTMFDFITKYFNVIPKELIHLSTPITQIEYQKHRVQLITAQGDRYTYAHVIVSVPISQLQQQRITFQPDLPAEKWRAIHSIGMGMGLKVILFFDAELDIRNPGQRLTQAPYYALHGIDSSRLVQVTTLLMGKYARGYYRDPDTYKLKLMEEISTWSDSDSTKLLRHAIYQDWSKEPFIEGTYSFPKPGEGSARAIAAAPILDTIFFIGEAMNANRQYGFIHGAMETARVLMKYF